MDCRTAPRTFPTIIGWDQDLIRRRQLAEWGVGLFGIGYISDDVVQPEDQTMGVECVVVEDGGGIVCGAEGTISGRILRCRSAFEKGKAVVDDMSHDENVASGESGSKIASGKGKVLMSEMPKNLKREMARFSVGGDEDGNEDRPINRPLPKRPRLFVFPSNKRPIVAANSRDRPTTSNAADSRNPSTITAAVGRISHSEERILAGEESERLSSDESEASWSDTSTGSSSAEEEEEEEDVQQQPQQNTGNEVQLAKAPVNRIASGSDEGTSGSFSVTLSDPDVLDCPICYEPLCSPVYQCENGHIACATCCTTMKNKCANCSWPIGYNRCRAIEKVLESVKITCRNMTRGCKDTFSYSKKLAHEKACTYTPCSCPHLGCDYVGVSKCLYAHFALKHSESSKQFHINDVISISLDKNQKTVFLQERILNTLFILNRSVEAVGSFVNVVCVAPTSEKRAFLYDIASTVGDSSVKLRSSVDIMPKWVVQPPTKVYLIIPSHFISSSGQLKLQLTIWRDLVHIK